MIPRRLSRTEPEFVIVGTGRSGTGYISTVLTAAGMRTGHEGWWNPQRRRRRGLVGDASWVAVFQLDDYRGHVFHQVRDPIRVVTSLAAVDLAGPRRHGDWARYRSKFIDGLTEDPIHDAMRIVDVWMTKSDQVAEWTWRLEDVDDALVHGIAERVGRQLKASRVSKAIEMVRTDVNSKVGPSKTEMTLSWDELPDGPLKQRLLAHAEAYGYV